MEEEFIDYDIVRFDELVDWAKKEAIKQVKHLFTSEEEMMKALEGEDSDYQFDEDGNLF
jgi:hypothetical protein